ncbi:hypothetical protein ACFLSQ_05795 [Bacteroidota bacterium]
MVVSTSVFRRLETTSAVHSLPSVLHIDKIFLSSSLNFSIVLENAE